MSTVAPWIVVERLPDGGFQETCYARTGRYPEEPTPVKRFLNAAEKTQETADRCFTVPNAHNLFILLRPGTSVESREALSKRISTSPDVLQVLQMREKEGARSFRLNVSLKTGGSASSLEMTRRVWESFTDLPTLVVLALPPRPENILSPPKVLQNRGLPPRDAAASSAGTPPQ